MFKDLFGVRAGERGRNLKQTMFSTELDVGLKHKDPEIMT